MTTTDSTPAPATSRAGRNLGAAVGVGVTLGAIVIASLAFRKEIFVVVMTAAIFVGAWELSRALRQAGCRVAIVPLLVGSASMMAGALLRGPEALVLTFGLTCVGILVWRVADGLSGAAYDIAGTLLVAIYPCFLAGFPALMLAEDDGHWRVIYFILVTVCSDIGGYAAGVLFGKHPMAPTVSPKKSWEGFAGSLLFCAAVGAVALVLLFDGVWWHGALIGVAVAIAATVGDLSESLIKRDLGIKDMSSILPGHGGVMDRLDSLIVTAPLVWWLLTVVVPT